MKRFIVLALVLCIAALGHAQNEDYRSTVSLNVGYGITNIASFALNTLNDSIAGSETFKASSLPQLSLNYDYGIKPRFSVGGSIAYARLSAKDDDYSTYVTDSLGNDVFKSGGYSATASRVSVGVRGLFHYGNSDKLDMYSGLRLGANFWSLAAESDVFVESDLPEQLSARATSVTLNYHLILFGLRGYLTDNIGLGFEICTLGAPHIVAANINYRF